MNKNVCSVALWLALSLLARSETYYVATNGVDTRTGTNYWTNAVLTISKAVDLASASDVVLVSNGLYVLTAEINVNKAITVRGFNGYSNTIVDGNYPAYSNRCFKLSASGVVIDGLTISNGCATNSEGGGGVYMIGGDILTNCLIIGNRATTNIVSQFGGGGISCNSQAALVYNCRIIGNINECTTVYGGGGGRRGSYFNCEIISNFSGRSGGGLYTEQAGTIISNCVIMYNLATNSGVGGGGISLGAGGQVVDCTIAMNLANNSGAGITLGGSSTMLFCNVYGNTAWGYGGGIIAYSVTYALIDRCSISNNVAVCNSSAEGGGGIFARTNVLVRNCLIASNKSVKVGGGIYADRVGNGGGGIQSCTIVGNRADTDGGGVSLKNTNNYIFNTIIMSNTSAAVATYNVNPATPETSSNFFRYCNTSITLADPSNTTNNPQFLNAAGFNYRLDGNSPCINTGSNEEWMTGAIDLDRYSRIDKFNRRVDMGCYEYIPRGTMFRFH